MKHKSHFLKGLRTLLVSALIALFLPTMFVSASRLGGGDFEAYQEQTEKIADAEAAKKAAEEEAVKAEEELLKKIMAKVEAGEELSEAEKETYETSKKLEEEKQKLEEAAKVEEEKQKAAEEAKKKQEELIKGYDAAESKEEYYANLNAEDKKTIDETEEARKAYQESEKIKQSAIKKVEDAGYVFEGIKTTDLDEAIKTVETLTEEEIEKLNGVLNYLQNKEKQVAEAEAEASKEAEEAEALYQDTLDKLKEAEDNLFGVQVGEHLECNGLEDNLERVICKLQQSDEDFAKESKTSFEPEECRYYEKGETYDRCLEKHTKINSCWAKPTNERKACVQKALGLPDKLVPVDQHCQGKTDDCKTKYQFAIYDLVGYKFLITAGQIETWYFDGQLPIDVAAFRVEQIMREAKAYYWAGEKTQKKEHVKNLQTIWDETKESLIEQIVEELKEEDDTLYETAKKEIAAGKKLEELSEEMQEVYNTKKLELKALAVEKYKINEEKGEDGFEGLNEEEKRLVEEALEEQSNETESEEVENTEAQEETKES